MDEAYKPGAVSSLIYLQTKSKAAEKSRKEQKKLDKLFGGATTKKDSQTTTNVSSDADVSKNFTDAKSKSSKKKKEKIEICEGVESSSPKKKKKKKEEDIFEESENVDSTSSKKKKKKKEKDIFEESENVDSTSSKKKKKKKEKDNLEETLEISKDVSKSREEKSPPKKKKKKNISSFEVDDDNINNKQEENNSFEEKTKTDKINRVKEKKRNNEDISNSVKKPKKFKEVTSDEKKSEKRKKRKIDEVAHPDEEDDDTLSKRKKFNKDVEKVASETLSSSPKKPRKKTNPPEINDVLCAIKESDGSKSRTRTTKQQDLSDIADEKPTRKRQKKKRDKKNDHRTVFVGNLPLSITKKQLKQMFTPCGQIENLRMRGAIPANPQRGKKYAILKKAYHSKCLSINAYICFIDKESAKEACKTMNGTVVEGQHIRVNSSIINKTGHDYKRSVFIGNLPFVISDEDVRQHFLDCGEIVDIRLVKDWKTGIGKGFGYVKFENTDSAELAIRLDNSVLKTRKIRVSPSESDAKNKRTDKGPVKKPKTEKKDKKEFVGVKAEKKKKKLKPKHLARKMGLAKTKTDLTPQKGVEKTTGGPNKHMVFK